MLLDCRVLMHDVTNSGLEALREMYRRKSWRAFRDERIRFIRKVNFCSLVLVRLVNKVTEAQRNKARIKALRCAFHRDRTDSKL